MNQKWRDYFMGFALHAAKMSKDSTKVGAVLVGPNREVRLTAYNGAPIGVEDRAERLERPMKYLFASHAEANLIAFAARSGIPTEGCTVVTTHHPCASCARTLIQAGIKTVIYAGEGFALESPYHAEFSAAKAMLGEAGVELLDNC